MFSAISSPASDPFAADARIAPEAGIDGMRDLLPALIVGDIRDAHVRLEDVRRVSADNPAAVGGAGNTVCGCLDSKPALDQDIRCRWVIEGTATTPWQRRSSDHNLRVTLNKPCESTRFKVSQKELKGLHRESISSWS